MDRLDFTEQWPIPEEFMLELGRITANFGILEIQVNKAITSLAGYGDVYDYRAAILLVHANFKQRLDILETLLETLSKKHENLKEYESVIKLIKSAQKSRNKFIHSELSYDKETQQMKISKMSARGKIKIEVNPIRINELKEASAKCHEASVKLHNLTSSKKTKLNWEK